MKDLLANRWTRPAWAVVAVLAASVSYADDEREQKPDRRGPPPVAIEACAAAVDGDACSFEGRRGDALQGECVTDREEILACRPDKAPPRLRRRDEQQPEEVDTA